MTTTPRLHLTAKAPARKRPPPFELFFALLEISLSPEDLEKVRFAYVVSKYGHRGQTRDSGERYFDHPKAAAWILASELGCFDARTIVNALLHDMCEDAYLLTGYRLKMNFGKEVALDIRALTKLPKEKESIEDYLSRVIERGPETILAKCVDRLHNLRTLESCSPEKRAKTIEETERFHLPALLPALRKHGDPWQRYAQGIDTRIREAINAVN